MSECNRALRHPRAVGSQCVAFGRAPIESSVCRARRVLSHIAGTESSSRRVVTLAANRAARLAAGFLEQAEASRVVIGDPTGVRDKDAGAVHNRRTHRWLVAHTRRALCYRLEEVGIAAELTDERGTSSHCPDCGAVARKRGRVLVCTDPACNTVHHRDVAGAQNMVRKLGRRDRSPPKEGSYQHFCRENRVEVAGVEPASPGILMGLLRAHPAEVSRVPPRHRRRCGTPAD